MAGGVITYFIKVLMIVTILHDLIEVDSGPTAVNTFHDYYGQLFSIARIVFYPLLTMGSRAFWWKTRNTDTNTDTRPLRIVSAS